MSEEQTFATVIAIDNALLTLPCVNRQGAGQDLGRERWNFIVWLVVDILHCDPDYQRPAERYARKQM
ncbi:TPA: hypothetical protein MIA68_25355 [Klebsiella pneumoniae]|uniref:Uncharacterized protein n=1 Tax=Klebsiella pneumoniae TaxID=573 RepID=A0A483EK81_KLEPN|nr:hypothetical protein FH42_26640 [Klebsiella pneumoniae]AZR60892.1 hypothetical protein ELE18_00140 [Klebsiella quasipneumoniae]EMR15438.1 hypothetical protein G000_26913 [Klebsiella pneumoniae ATCC BAA-2146]KHE28733.1 hypothetical protein JG24_02725 [Klebsiella variicola]KMK36350.1 hypothetical protein ABW14_26105 [Klebsiella michiganensis]KTH21120.1 hypothetical protein ASV30_22910 [Enterobacter hormaechei subsp. xiangfangensis]KTH25206.1 hypothetical protein ASV28_15580 [Enterobacter clo